MELHKPTRFQRDLIASLVQERISLIARRLTEGTYNGMSSVEANALFTEMHNYVILMNQVCGIGTKNIKDAIPLDRYNELMESIK